jgi:hypothetical protein
MQRITLLYYALPFIPNLLCTLLIVGKLLWHRRALRATQANIIGGEYSFIASCLAESGAVYTTAGIVNFILVSKGDRAQMVSSAVFGASAVRVSFR